MAVENNTIIKKMIDELYLAKENQHSRDKMVRHISNVRVLCDLFLEEDSAPTTTSISSRSNDEISQAELKAMIGNQGQVKKTVAHDDDSSGDSIFDF